MDNSGLVLILVLSIGVCGGAVSFALLTIAINTKAICDSLKLIADSLQKIAEK